MRHVFAFPKKSIILFLWLLAALSCSKKNPASPGGSTDTPLASQSIGPSGGTLESDGFILTVPQGALDSETALSLYAVSSPSSGENAVTPVFRIEGLPDDYAKPLRMALRFTGALKNESFIGLGRMGADPVAGDSSMVYEMLAAADSSGFLVGHLAVPGADGIGKGGLRQAGEQAGMEARGFSDMKTDESSPRFVIHYPSGIEPRLDRLKGLLDECYWAVTGPIFLKFDDVTWHWPVHVYVADGENSVHMVQYYLNLFACVNRSWVEDDARSPDLKNAFGCSLLIEALKGYVDINREDVRWLVTAVVTWAEEKFAEPEPFQSPARFRRNEMAPFEGMAAGLLGETYTHAHGYGMSALIKYLYDDPRYAAWGLRNTFHDMGGAYKKHSIRAILEYMEALVADWWPDFIGKYIGGNIYNVASTVFMDPDNASG
ncbi:hypothetical protein JW906_09315, partial [bacterium]|nr:hypothetical protein [bacterium]